MTARAIYSHEPARGWLPWGVLAPFLCVVFIVAPLLGVSNVLQSLQLLDARDHPLGLPGLLAFLVVPFSTIGLVVLAWAHFVERRSLATIGLGGSARVRTFLRGFAVGLATSFGVVAAIWMVGGFESAAFAKAFESPGAMMSIGLLLVGFGVQSSVEEIVSRGWLLSAIAGKFNIVAAVVLTSLVFTLLHYGPQQHWLVTVSSFLFSVFTVAGRSTPTISGRSWVGMRDGTGCWRLASSSPSPASTSGCLHCSSS